MVPRTPRSPYPSATPVGVVAGMPWTWTDAYYDADGHLCVAVPGTPVNAPPDVRRGLDLRREALLGAGCSGCGAERVFGSRRDRRAGRAGLPHVHHRPGCPAGDRALTEAVARWQAQWDAEAGR